MAMKYIVFYLCVAAAYHQDYQESEAEEKTPDNNPDLNRKDIGAMQNAWKSIEYASNETYYLVYSNLDDMFYKYWRCVWLRTSALNETSMTANYTMGWNQYSWRDYKKGEPKSRSGYVQAVKQADYALENVMRFSNTGKSVPHSALGAPNGSYNLITTRGYSCNAEICDQWVKYHKNDYVEKYVVFSQPSCFILRSMEDFENAFSSPPRPGCALNAVCEFWLRSSDLNETLASIEKKNRTKNKEETTTQRNAYELEPPKYSTEQLFKKLPKGCRLAFLLNCGYPTTLNYNKNDCDKINITENDVHGKKR